jgi:hypothetical protein
MSNRVGSVGSVGLFTPLRGRIHRAGVICAFRGVLAGNGPPNTPNPPDAQNPLALRFFA